MTLFEQQGNLTIWWFPKDFSQSRFGEFQRSGTNSCTLISLIVADKVSKEGPQFHSSISELPRHAINIFSSAINEGNAVYDRVFKTLRGQNALIQRHGSSQNLNIPDAMTALKSTAPLNFQLHEWFYTHLRVDPRTDPSYNLTVAFRLAQIFNVGADMLRRPSRNMKGNPPRFLFAALIADSRTVIFTFDFDANMVAFFDSHQHGRKAGAVIAQCMYPDILEMTHWFINMLDDVYSSKPSTFEVSFLTKESDRIPRLESPKSID